MEEWVGDPSASWTVPHSPDPVPPKTHSTTQALAPHHSPQDQPLPPTPADSTGSGTAHTSLKSRRVICLPVELHYFPNPVPPKPTVSSKSSYLIILPMASPSPQLLYRPHQSEEQIQTTAVRLTRSTHQKKRDTSLHQRPGSPPEGQLLTWTETHY